MSDENSLRTYKAMRRIADIVFDIWSPDPTSSAWQEDRRNQGVNPYYNQTTGGLFIEQYYGGPGQIWTPWGSWNCWGSGTSRQDLMEEFLKLVGETAQAIPVKHTKMGTYGPIYAVIRVEDVILPKAERRDMDSFTPYDEAIRLWEEVDRQFREELANA